MILTNTKKGILTIVGGILIHLGIGSIYSFGLLNPFMVSYLNSFDSKVTPEDGFFLLPLGLIFLQSFVLIGGLLERRAGPIR